MCSNYFIFKKSLKYIKLFWPSPFIYFPVPKVVKMSAQISQSCSATSWLFNRTRKTWRLNTFTATRPSWSLASLTGRDQSTWRCVSWDCRTFSRTWRWEFLATPISSCLQSRNKVNWFCNAFINSWKWNWKLITSFILCRSYL